MKRIPLMALTLLLISAAPLLARPVEVLVFPNGAIVTEQGSVAVKDGTATLTLPAVADTGSLKIATVESKATIGGLQFDSVVEKAGDYQALKAKIEATRDRLQGVEDRRSARAQALEQLKAPLGDKFATAEEYRKLSELVLTRSELLNTEHSQLLKEKKEIEEELQELERQLAEATDRQKRHWVVQVALSDVGEKVTLHYSYRVYNANWQPLYSLDARPAEKAIHWDWTAKVSQSTAVDWKDVRLQLATAEPVFTLTPPDNQPWIIREERPVAYRSRLAPAKAMAPMAVEPMAEMDMLLEKEEAPTRQAGTLFDIYDLGRRTLIAGESYQLDIRKGDWPATFDYLLRPLQSPQAFLLAKVEFDELLPMPSGEAAILVEGVYVGKRGFDLLEKKIDLPFGNDPQIQVKVTPTREAGEAGLFGGDRTQSWHWRIVITNNKNIPVTLRMEDSLPRIEDTRIKLVETVSENAAPDEHLAKWEFALAPGAEKTIEYGYRIKYPDDMQVEPGR